jgi:putative transposase
MRQVVRTLTFADTRACRFLICDRDAKWSPAFQTLLADAGQQVVRTPYQAPNVDTHAERFVGSIKEECLNRLVPLGDRHFRLVIAEYLEHYHRERNHQGLDNELIAGAVALRTSGPVRRRARLGGLLNYYARAA